MSTPFLLLSLVFLSLNDLRQLDFHQVREKEATGASDMESDSMDELQDILWSRMAREGSVQASGETSDQNQTAAYQNIWQSEGRSTTLNGDDTAHDDYNGADDCATILPNADTAHDDYNGADDGATILPTEDSKPSFWAQPTEGVGPP